MKSRETIWPWAVFAAALAGWFAGRGGMLPASWWLVPWVLSLGFFGLPHGAVDHEVLLRLWRPALPPRRALGAVLAGYLAASLLVFLGWFAVPRLVFVGFIVLTWVHWGLADLWWSWRRESAYFSSRWHRGVFAAWRGALPMLIPLAVDPGLYRQTAEGVCNLFLHQPANFRWLELNAVRLAALGIAVGLGVTDFVLARREARTRWLNLAEGLALLAFFGLLPALASVGFYFACWHGLRHVRRLMASEGMSWGQFAWRATPATLGALAMLGLLALLVRPGTDAGRVVGIYLALIAALTVPHAVTVTLMDTRDRLWRPDR